tara:strand:+ start:244 stop:360 length:117 start_codon:yes stop_codon:yes gene_type:complete
MAFDRNLHPASTAITQSGKIGLHRIDLWQDLFGQPQQT